MPESDKESKDKLEFPILYPQCPHCGCEETVAAKYKALQVAAGLMKDDTALFTSMAPAALSDMREPHIALDFLLIFKDICMRCGAERVVRIDKGQGLFGAPGGMPGRAETQFGRPVGRPGR